MGNAAKVFNKYIDAFTSGDGATAAGLLADNFKFHGPMLQADTKAAFLEGAAQLCPIVRGYKMLKQWEDGDDVCSVYDFQIETPKGKGAITMSEWTTVKNGKLASSRLIFDSQAFMALMPEPQ